MMDYPETCWKPPETGRGDFRQVSEFFISTCIFFSKFVNKKIRKPAGNRHGLFPEHTGLIGSRSFQNYAFKGWLSLETMKLWLLVLTKTIDLD